MGAEKFYDALNMAYTPGAAGVPSQTTFFNSSQRSGSVNF